MQVGSRPRRQGCVRHACAEVYKSLTSRMMWLYRSSFLPSFSLTYSPHWLCHCLATSNSGQASPSMRASWWSAVVLDVSVPLLWHFLLTLFAAYQTSVQARVGCAPWHSSRIWFVPQPYSLTASNSNATIITAACHRRLGWYVPIQWHQMNAEVGGTFFFEQSVYSLSGFRSLSVLCLCLCLWLFYYLCFFSLFLSLFCYVEFLLPGVPFSFPNCVSIFPLRTTSLEVSLPSLWGTVTFWVPYMAAGPWCGPARPE